MEIRLLLVPYDSGQRNVRMGAGPEHLRAAGLEKHLAAQGHQVDSEVIEPASRNWRAEVQTSFELMRAVAKHVRAARTAKRFPLVLSGNCLAAVGVIAGLGAGTGVVWIDAHGDFNTPQTTTSGFLDGMTLATATGQCWGELANSIEGFQPVPDNAVVLLGARDLDAGRSLGPGSLPGHSLECRGGEDRSRPGSAINWLDHGKVLCPSRSGCPRSQRRTSQRLFSAGWFLARRPASTSLDCRRAFAGGSSHHRQL